MRLSGVNCGHLKYISFSNQVIGIGTPGRLYFIYRYIWKLLKTGNYVHVQINCLIRCYCGLPRIDQDQNGLEQPLFAITVDYESGPWDVTERKSSRSADIVGVTKKDPPRLKVLLKHRANIKVCSTSAAMMMPLHVYR